MAGTVERRVGRADASSAVIGEPQAVTRPFSKKAEKALGDRGFTVVDLSKIELPYSWDATADERIMSPSHVAIDLDHFFFEGSAGKTLSGQREMLKEYTKILGIPGVAAVPVTVTVGLKINEAYKKLRPRGQGIFWDNDGSARTISENRHPVGVDLNIGDTYNDTPKPGDLSAIWLYVDEHQGGPCPPSVYVVPCSPNLVHNYLKMPAVLVPAR